jgi:hypothetical protein
MTTVQTMHKALPSWREASAVEAGIPAATLTKATARVKPNRSFS